MAHSNGLIYVDNTTTPATGVSVYDVQQVLNVSSNDVGTLCVHNNVKKWAKRKPIRVGQIAPITDTQIKAANYGFNINASFLTGTPDAIAKSVAPWSYQRPQGGAASPYRLSDFNGYSHNVVCPFSASGFDRVTTDIIPKAAYVYIDGEIGAVDTQHNVLVSDIFDLNQYGNYRLTLAVVDYTDSNNPQVIRYFFSPYTLNDPNAPALENRIITVTTIPSSEDQSLAQYNPVDGRTYTGVVMLTNRTFTQQEIEANAYRMGIYPNAMNGVTAVSLQLEDGINKFQFTYSDESDIEDDDYIRWAAQGISVYPTNESVQITGHGGVQLGGTPALYSLDDFTYAFKISDSKKSEFTSVYANSQFQARIYIQGPHYMWSPTSSGPEDWGEYTYVQGSAQYEVTDWLTFSQLMDEEYDSSNIPSEGALCFSLQNFIKYSWHIYRDGTLIRPPFYPIILDVDSLPTYISFQIYYRQQYSGNGRILGDLSDGDEIANANDHIDIYRQWQIV